MSSIGVTSLLPAWPIFPLILSIGLNTHTGNSTASNIRQVKKRIGGDPKKNEVSGMKCWFQMVSDILKTYIGYRIVAKFVPDGHGSGKTSDVPFYPVSVELPPKKALGEW